MNKNSETGMNGSELIKYEEIQNKIYTIRGVQVMLDEDLALLYGVETKVLNQAVKRNSERFPEDFMFQLSEEEYKLLRSQNVTLEKWDSLRSQNATIEARRGQHRKYMPYVFTEQGGCTIPMHTCKGVHKKAIELCIGTEGMYRYCACFTGGAQNNSFEFDGFGKYLDFNYGEFTTIKSQVVLNRFTLTPKQWIEISQQDVGQFAQITWDHNSLIIPKCGNLKKVKVV